MMPAAFSEENGVLDAPLGEEDRCDSLSVWRGMTDGAQPIVVSCWKPTVEEMEEIKRTGRVWIMIWGTTMPPICPLGTSPFSPR